jgi:hypothetical protein
MKYFFAGLITGALLSLIFLQGKSASELIPVFYSNLAEIKTIEGDAAESFSAEYVLSSSDYTKIIDESGLARKVIPAEEKLFEFSKSGGFYITYSNTGRDVEFFGLEGQRYWKIDSGKKPFLSANGRLIFLLTSDHSSIRVIDRNGNPGAQEYIRGRLCTVIEFSDRGDYGACGFADGSFYFVNEKGEIIYSGSTPAGSVVKGIAVSSNGLYGLVHFGSDEKDFLSIVDVKKGKEKNYSLDHVHYVKTSLMISSSGDAFFFDIDRLLSLNSSGRLKFLVEVPEKKPGFSALSEYEGAVSLSYTDAKGSGRFLFFRENGDIFYSAAFPEESFLDSKIVNDFIFLRGSESLSVYSFHRAESL